MTAKMNFSNEQYGSFYAIISGFFYGLIGYFGVNIINANLTINNMLFWRFLVASIIIALMLLPKIKHIATKPKEILKALFYGAAFYGPSATAYFLASKYIGTGLAMVIFFTYPALVLFLNWLFFRTSITKLYFLAIIMISIGVFLLVDLEDGIKFDIIGLAFGILSAAFYAGYIIVSKRTNMSPILSTQMVSIGCALICFALAFLDGSLEVPTHIYTWLNILAISLICTALPILFLLEALKYISSEKAAILSVLEPVFVVIFGIILLGETINLLQITGVLTILGGAILTLYKRKIKD